MPKNKKINLAARNVKNIFNQGKEFKLQEKYEETIEKIEGEGEASIRLSRSDDEDDDVPISEIDSKANEKFKTIEIRKKIHDELTANLRSNAQKAMKKKEIKHNYKRSKKTVVSELANNVSIKIPSIDHGGTELRRLPCVIVDVHHDKYKLACQWGILEDLYGAQNLEIYHGLIEFNSKTIENPISLRSSAIAASNGKRDKPMNEVEVKCNCMANQSQAKNCKCFNSGLKCNSHCHSKTPTNKCKNKD